MCNMLLIHVFNFIMGFNMVPGVVSNPGRQTAVAGDSNPDFRDVASLPPGNDQSMMGSLHPARLCASSLNRTARCPPKTCTAGHHRCFRES